MTTTEARLLHLETRVHRLQLLATGLALLLVVCISLGWKRQVDTVDHIRVRRLELVDARGVVRLALGEDATDELRRSRGAGLTVHDRTGAERGGFLTFDDGTVALAMDAPAGVGDAMRERLALGVETHGGASVILLDNSTRAVAKLHSDGSGGGGVQVFRWDEAEEKVHVKTLTYAGEERQSMPLPR